MQNEAKSVDELLIKAHALFNARQDEEALRLSRIAAGQLFAMFHSNMQGETLVKLLACLRGLAIEALVTGRDGEGRTALGTALAYVDVGLKHWPSAPPLLTERNILLELENKTSGNLTALIRDPDTDDWTWPFDD